jgi:RNA polymerase sigma factor (sigma-70 family)
MAQSSLQLLMRHIRRQAERNHTSRLTDAQLLERFLAVRDEEAFAALVRRHAGLVLAACRRGLTNATDIEDAFQATFLVLLRKADAIRSRQALGSWLYRVATRVAAQAGAAAERRRQVEAKSAVSAERPAPDPSWHEVRALLHVEMDRLPERLRLPLILCYLDGKTRDEAAAQLGWSSGALRGRLERGRHLLRARLARRGVELTAGVLALLADNANAGVWPVHLIGTTARLAAGGPCPAAVAALAHAVTAAPTTKAVLAIGVMLTVGLVVGGTGMALAPAGAPQNRGMAGPPKAAAQTPAVLPADAAVLQGRVLGPDGKPVPGARLFVCDSAGRTPAPQPTVDADGRFRFALESLSASDSRMLVAMADGLGMDWTDLRWLQPNSELTLRLPADVPVSGKVVDLQGRSLCLMKVEVIELTTSESGNLDEFLKQWAADKEKAPTGPVFHLLTARQFRFPKALSAMFSTTTAPDGTFRLTGIGRDRGVMLRFHGAGSADHYMRLVTRPDYQPRPAGEGQVSLSGPELSVALAEGKPIVGTVRDARTKQPLAGVRVIGYTPDRPMHWWWQPVETVTDAQGYYELDGLSKTAKQIVLCDPGPGATHMHRFDEVADTAGFDPITHDTELHRGVVVSGRVTDKATGRPVKARVVYSPLITNGHFNTTPGYAAPRTQLNLWIDSREMMTDADGRYRLTALPGLGGLFVMAAAGGADYTHPPTPPKEEQDPAIYHQRAEVFFTIGLGDIFPLPDIHAYRLIRPAADAATLTADFPLDPGLSRKGRLLDPEGRPLAGADAFNLTTRYNPRPTLPGVEFTAVALTPAKPRRLLFWHDERKLAGTIVLRGDEPEPVTVTLKPPGALTGRAVLKTTGEPLVGYAVECSAWPELDWPSRDKRRERAPVLTDKDGRFRVSDLPAGVPLVLSVMDVKSRFAPYVGEKILLEPGQTKDLGDLRGDPKPDEP